MSEVKLEDIVSLAKRRGFIYPSSEIYGGLAGVYDYGPLGVKLKHNIQNLWWNSFVSSWEDMYPLDAAILMNKKVWEASGHVDTFTDPLVECSNCHTRFRADQFVPGLPKNSTDKLWLEKWVDAFRGVHGFNVKNDLMKALDATTASFMEKKIICPACGKLSDFGEPRQFNMMFKTNVGPTEDKDSVSYLRPETAQGMFVNFKNVVDTFYPDMPFGMAQIGKAFRNEISPREFLFRLREMEQMEIEYFVHKDQWEEKFEDWRAGMQTFFELVGLPKEKVHELEVPKEDRAHYSERTIDFEFDFPFGRRELAGLAYRTDYDLKKHQEESGKSLEYRPKDGGDPYLPHVIEPSMGVERLVLAILSAAYTEDEVEGEKRIYLKLPTAVAPIKVAVSPLLKNKPQLVAKAKEVYQMLKDEIGEVMWDDNGNIGKRYRRQDEIGTPHCVTIDFQTLEDDTVTLRNRDTTIQERIKTPELIKCL